MAYTDDELNYISDKTDGYCYHCGKELAFRNYGVVGAGAGWEVDHSRSRSEGGTDYFSA
jgi:hypothetical protein